jgi:hypothetical protein
VFLSWPTRIIIPNSSPSVLSSSHEVTCASGGGGVRGSGARGAAPAGLVGERASHEQVLWPATGRLLPCGTVFLQGK